MKKKESKNVRRKISTKKCETVWPFHKKQLKSNRIIHNDITRLLRYRHHVWRCGSPRHFTSALALACWNNFFRSYPFPSVGCWKEYGTNLPSCRHDLCEIWPSLGTNSCVNVSVVCAVSGIVLLTSDPWSPRRLFSSLSPDHTAWSANPYKHDKNNLDSSQNVSLWSLVQAFVKLAHPLVMWRTMSIGLCLVT
jgi:hypothetical protein